MDYRKNLSANSRYNLSTILLKTETCPSFKFDIFATVQHHSLKTQSNVADMLF